MIFMMIIVIIFFSIELGRAQTVPLDIEDQGGLEFHLGFVPGIRPHVYSSTGLFKWILLRKLFFMQFESSHTNKVRT